MECIGKVLAKTARKSLVSVASVLERLMMIQLKSKFSNLSLMQVCAPDLSRLDKGSEDVCSQLESLVNTISKKDFTVVLVDFNAILGNDNSGN
ncbi:hypothetical protein QYM36_012429 [Artemia franciscana]|uniref:Uncharacterized protein n=1 Tax=Artemia franciscana TaxID=6661 RepID=A0AA88HKS6_ARTSF|nr:hypothetical protein QYM36_012429 [Artemia franciscana]